MDLSEQPVIARGGLALHVTAPAHHRVHTAEGISDPTSMTGPCREAREVASGAACLPLPAPPPAHRRPVRGQSAGMGVATANLREARVEPQRAPTALLLSVVAPAQHLPVDSDPARVVSAGRDMCEPLRLLWR